MQFPCKSWQTDRENDKEITLDVHVYTCIGIHAGTSPPTRVFSDARARNVRAIRLTAEHKFGTWHDFLALSPLSFAPSKYLEVHSRFASGPGFFTSGSSRPNFSSFRVRSLFDLPVPPIAIFFFFNIPPLLRSSVVRSLGVERRGTHARGLWKGPSRDDYY